MNPPISSDVKDLEVSAGHKNKSMSYTRGQYEEAEGYSVEGVASHAVLKKTVL